MTPLRQGQHELPLALIKQTLSPLSGGLIVLGPLENPNTK